MGVEKKEPVSFVDGIGEYRLAILNYTTSIKTEKTSGEIQQILALAGAQAIMTEYDSERIMCAMSFRIDTPHGMITFRLPANAEGVYRCICSSNVARSYKTREQAARTAWRILKSWIEAQLAIVDAEMSVITEVFLPYAQNSQGQTVYQALEAGGFKQLTHDS